MADQDNQRKDERKDYYPPKIVHTEDMTARTVTCAKATDADCASGPIGS